MDSITIAIAKLAGARKTIESLLSAKAGHHLNPYPIQNFSAIDAGALFRTAAGQLQILKERLPHLFSDFEEIKTDPTISMAQGPAAYSRQQLEHLGRAIDEVFEIRANSELEQPKSEHEARVFISHGRATDWREIQPYIEKDLGIPTLELEQQPNLGRTILQKLQQESDKCTYAVIVMTGDDTDASGTPRARENVMHEIGYFQGKFGLAAVCLLHEEGTNIPSNIHGLVYVPFPKGTVRATFGALARELKHFYNL